MRTGLGETALRLCGGDAQAWRAMGVFGCGKTRTGRVRQESRLTRADLKIVVQDLAGMREGRLVEAGHPLIYLAANAALVSSEADMTKVTLDLPEEVFSALRRSPDEFGREMRLAATIHWYEQGAISQEKQPASRVWIESIFLPH